MKKIILLMIVLNVMFGCASGIGVNKNMYFEPQASINLPVRLDIDPVSKPIKSGGIMSAPPQNFTQTYGLGVAILTSSQGFSNLVRGKFSASEAFEKTVNKLNADSNKNSDNEVKLRLTYFQQYIVPSHVIAFMVFNANPNPNETYVSAYSCNITVKTFMFSANAEKNMLNEMVDSTMTHWAKTLVENKDMEFPEAERGTLSADGVECKYELNVKQSELKAETQVKS